MLSAPHNAAENVQRVSKDLRARPPNCQIKVQFYKEITATSELCIQRSALGHQDA